MIADHITEKARRVLESHRAGSSPRPDLTTSCSCGAVEPATSEGWLRQAQHPIRDALEAVADDLRAEAWEQGNRVGWSDCTLDTVAALKAITTNPYRKEQP